MSSNWPSHIDLCRQTRTREDASLYQTFYLYDLYIYDKPSFTLSNRLAPTTHSMTSWNTSVNFCFRSTELKTWMQWIWGNLKSDVAELWMSDSCAIPRASTNEAISWVWRTRVNEWSIHRPGDFNSEIYPFGYVLLYPVFILTNL